MRWYISHNWVFSYNFILRIDIQIIYNYLSHLCFFLIFNFNLTYTLNTSMHVWTGLFGLSGLKIIIYKCLYAQLYGWHLQTCPCKFPLHHLLANALFFKTTYYFYRNWHVMISRRREKNDLQVWGEGEAGQSISYTVWLSNLRVLYSYYSSLGPCRRSYSRLQESL